MNQIIFTLLITLLSLSDQAAYIGCDAPIPLATQCWIISPASGVTAWLSPAGITYTETKPVAKTGSHAP